MNKACSVCTVSSANLMKCNACASSFHPKCGHYIRHVWRGGYCPKPDCQTVKANRFLPKSRVARGAEDNLVNHTEVRASQSHSTEPSDTDSQNSERLARTTRRVLLQNKVRAYRKRFESLAAKHDLFISPEASATNCHLCNRKVRPLAIKECGACDRVFCCFCLQESDRLSELCRVCKGVCSCRVCYEDTYSADLELISKRLS
jgi:hypothetical protein